MKRLILAIVAAILINFILASAIDHGFHVAGIYPPYGEPMMDNGLMALAFSYRAIITIFAAYITAMIAKEKAKTAIYFTGIIGTVLWLAGAIFAWDFGPAWYHIVGILSALPLAITGWKIYERKTNKQTGA
ncbi:MAG: hypothetical protein HYV29_12600 [Ignavibacteriales bacterium]|nr:hypothetical protein [Ignavibacteriales bacterium]